MKILLTIAVLLLPSVAHAADPIATIQEKLAADLAAYSATAGSLAQVQGQLQSLQTTVGSLTVTLSAAQAAVSADIAQLQSLIGPTPGPAPSPVPPVPVGPVVSMVVVGSTTCLPCVQMHADIDALRASGLAISRVDTDVDPSAVKYNVTATPTTVVLVNGTEKTRHVGKLDKASLADWFARSQDWANKYAK